MGKWKISPSEKDDTTKTEGTKIGFKGGKRVTQWSELSVPKP